MNDFLKSLLEQRFEDISLSMGLPVLEEHVKRDEFEVSWDEISKEEKECVLSIQTLARQLGSDPGSYSLGVLSLAFKNKQALVDFMDGVDLLSCSDYIDDVDIEVRGENLEAGLMTQQVDFRDVMFDGNFEFTAYIYLNPEIVQYPSFEIEPEGDEFEYEDETGRLVEVRRRIKVNSRGVRRIKMQCRPGFKWDVEKKTCLKIGGAEVAKMRKSVRRMVRTKRSLGTGFKTRVLRKQRRANKFRKSMGLK